MFENRKTPIQNNTKIFSHKTPNQISQFQITNSFTKSNFPQDKENTKFRRLFSPYIVQKGLQSVQQPKGVKYNQEPLKNIKSKRALFQENNDNVKEISIKKIIVANKQSMSLSQIFQRKYSNSSEQSKNSKEFIQRRNSNIDSTAKKNNDSFDISYSKNPQYYENLQKETKNQLKKKSKSFNSQCVEMCFFHQNKKGKWCVNDRKSEYDNNFLCSKCAMKIAQSGIQVVTMSKHFQKQNKYKRKNGREHSLDIASDEQKIKEQKINDFLNKLFVQNQKTLDVKLNLESQCQILNQNHEEQKEFVTDTFEQMQVMIIQRQQEVLNRIDNQYEQSRAEISQALKAVDQNIDDMNNIESDIKSHYKKIINKIKLNAFDNIIKQYQFRVDQYYKVEQFLKTETISSSSTEFPQLQNFSEYLRRNFKVIEQNTSYIQQPEQEQEENIDVIQEQYENKHEFLRALCHDKENFNYEQQKENNLNASNFVNKMDEIGKKIKKITQISKLKKQIQNKSYQQRKSKGNIRGNFKYQIKRKSSQLQQAMQGRQCKTPILKKKNYPKKPIKQNQLITPINFRKLKKSQFYSHQRIV